MSIKSDTDHLYLEIVDRIKKDIDRGIYKEDEKLPSEFDLAKQLGVSRQIVREALRVLEEENIIVHRHGVGTFVNPKPLFTSGIEELFSVTEMIKRVGKKPGTIFISSTSRKATEDDVNKFNCSKDEEIVIIERVRTSDDEPVVYCIDQIPKSILPKNFTHESGSIFDLFEREAGCYISYAVTTIEPLGFSEKISPILHCEVDASLLVMKQMHFDQNDNPVFYSCNYFRADKFSFHVLRKRS
ncbi:GntR family transcriptional regulator [Calidifontibacillus erzurumensis]|uniref:GntR family transcriptional regulator n=1 Tax=Calidifontibacillus erzurumensis TaxID=2741433 RepID=A0A8J8GEU9_9BACI|nr:GntR family transcriptional regulator [Calidifontibacillus erzurumensis]NSL51123.1 GntR family transcriptional regulator [Calidifontibacillus erzurumensis]